jgi:hypothetical protein
MKLIDMQKQTATVTSAATITLGAAVSGFRTLAQAITAGDLGVSDSGIPFFVRDPGSGAWESGLYTVTSATVLTREKVVGSSSNNAAVAFGGATCEVYCAAPASLMNGLKVVRDIPFATAVPLNVAGESFMPQQTVSAPLAFTVMAGAVRGALVRLRLVADGVNVPTFSGMQEFGGSSGFDNRSGVINTVEFYNDGYDTWYYIGQAVNASIVDTVRPTPTTASVDNATPTNVFIVTSEVLDMSADPPIGAFTVAGHTVTAATIYYAAQNMIRLTVSTAFVGGEAARSVTYAPTGTNDVKDTSGNKMLGFTLPITNNVAAPAGSPATGVTLSGPTGGTVGVASTNFTVGVTPVGGTITGTVVVTPSDSAGGSTFTPATVSLTTASPTATFTCTAAWAGTKTISVTNNGGLTNPANLSYVAADAVAATVPAAPTIGTAVAGDGYVDVYFTRNSNGGAAVLDSTATLSSGQTATGTASPIRVTAPNGTAVTATVKDRNSVGSSAASAASNSVTPTVAAPSAYPRFVSQIGLTETGTGPYTYTGVAGKSYPEQQANANKALDASSGDGSLSFRFESITSNGFAFGVTTAATYQVIANMTKYVTITGGKYLVNTAGSSVNAGANMSPAEGDIVRFRRAGGAIYGEVARAATPTTFVLIGSWASSVAGERYFNLVVQGAAKITLLDAVGLV